MKKNLIALLFLIGLMTACGSQDSEMTSESYMSEKSVTESLDYKSNDIYAEEYSYEDYDTTDSYESESYNSNLSDYDENVAAQSEKNLENRKLITTLDMNVETENFEELIDTVETRVKKLGGYVESSSFSSDYKDLMNANYCIRIPEDNLESFVSLINEKTNITYKSTSVEDVTLSYVDIEARKKVYTEEEKRLLEMMEEAVDIDTLLNIEMRLSEVQAEIESLEATLRSYDNRCLYSTIYLNINEVEVYTVIETKELSTFEKMKEGFINSLKDVLLGLRDFFVDFVIALPYLVIFGLIIFIIITIIKVIAKHKKKRKEKIKINTENISLEKNENTKEK